MPGFFTLYAQDGQFVDESGDTMTGNLILPLGSADEPALQLNDDGEGLYSNGGELRLVTNHTDTYSMGAFTLRFTVNTGGALQRSNGSATTPAILLRGITDSDTGIGGDGADNVSIIAGGTEVIDALASSCTIRAPVSNPAQSTTLGAAATTLAITSDFVILTGDGGGNTLSTITGGVDGQRLTIAFVDGNVDINHGTGSNNVALSGAANFTTIAADTVLTLVYDGTHWLEVTRSLNA
jgi:hypothetical protein